MNKENVFDKNSGLALMFKSLGLVFILDTSKKKKKNTPNFEWKCKK